MYQFDDLISEKNDKIPEEPKTACTPRSQGSSDWAEFETSKKHENGQK